MFNYKKREVNFEYPLPKDLFVNFLVGKDETFPSKYFDDIERLIEDFDKVSLGESHRVLYETNYSFYIKLLTNIMNRLNSVSARVLLFDNFKNNIAKIIETENIANSNTIIDGSLIFTGVGRINKSSKNLDLIKNSLKELHGNYYKLHIHELDSRKFKNEINRIDNFLHIIIKELNKITNEIKVISDHLINFLVSILKNKALQIKDKLHKKIIEESSSKSTYNPNNALAVDKYREGFNNSMHEMFVLEIEAFKSKVNSNIKLLPDILCTDHGKAFSNQIVLSEFDMYVSSLIEGSSQTDYFNLFISLYNKYQSKAA